MNLTESENVRPYVDRACEGLTEAEKQKVSIEIANQLRGTLDVHGPSYAKLKGPFKLVFCEACREQGVALESLEGVYDYPHAEPSFLNVQEITETAHKYKSGGQSVA